MTIDLYETVAYIAETAEDIRIAKVLGTGLDTATLEAAKARAEQEVIDRLQATT